MDNYNLTVSLKAEPIICVGGSLHNGSCDDKTFFIITNSMISSVLFLIICFLLFWSGARNAKLIPGRWQSIIEIAIESLYNLVLGATNRRVTRVIFPLVATYFIWIMAANWLSLLPGMGSIGFVHTLPDGTKDMVPLFRGPNADLNMTFSMAVPAIIIVQIAAIVSHGFVGWLKEFYPEPHWMAPLLTPLEIIGQFTRILSLAFRLFGNIFAGEVLIAVMLKLFAPSVIIFLGLELFVGFIQALVFAMLTLTYLALVVSGGHDEHEEKHEEEHPGYPADTAEQMMTS